MMELEVTLIFDNEPFRRRAVVDLKSLPLSAAEMPETIAGRLMFAEGDIALIELSTTKIAIFNSTQVEYTLEMLNKGWFTATRSEPFRAPQTAAATAAPRTTEGEDGEVMGQV